MIFETLTGITGPKKWLTLPFGSLEPKLIESRRIFLERYLQVIPQEIVHRLLKGLNQY